MASDQPDERTLRKRKGQLTKGMDTLFPQESNDQCRVCLEPVVDGRWNYCSERCRMIANAVQRMFIWDEVRERVLERDGKTCQRCGVSYERWERAHWQVKERIDQRTEHLRDEDMDEWRERRRELEEIYGVPHPVHQFEVDHIQPIADGGHPFDERNLQTLCKECHSEKTAEENRTEEEQTERPEVGLEEYIYS